MRSHIVELREQSDTFVLNAKVVPIEGPEAIVIMHQVIGGSDRSHHRDRPRGQDVGEREPGVESPQLVKPRVGVRLVGYWCRMRGVGIVEVQPVADCLIVRCIFVSGGHGGFVARAIETHLSNSRLVG